LRPQSTEAQIVMRYYSRAVQIIRGYHDADNDHAFLRAEIRGLEKKAEAAESKQARTKLLNNLRAIETYMETYGERRWKIIACPRIYHSSNSVRISATLDLTIIEGKRRLLVKLGVRKASEHPEIIRLTLRVIYQAAVEKLQITPEDVFFFDISKREILRGSRGDADLARTIEMGCARLYQMVHSWAA
ncbi:MAG: hypothetical protein WBF42_12060, partial [Terracidiphilus sp.]